jgi:hypothetical protein
MAAVAAAIAGCAGGGHAGDAQSPSVALDSNSPTIEGSTHPPTPDARAQVLSQYRAFWARLAPASRAAPGKRRELLAPYATDPELGSLLSGMARGDEAGTVFYGRDEPHPVVAQLSAPQGLAVIRDCQDSSHSGNAVRSTGRRLTVGIARHLVIATMHSVDGTWRVASVTYKQAKC